MDEEQTKQALEHDAQVPREVKLGGTAPNFGTAVPGEVDEVVRAARVVTTKALRVIERELDRVLAFGEELDGDDLDHLVALAERVDVLADKILAVK